MVPSLPLGLRNNFLSQLPHKFPICELGFKNHDNSKIEPEIEYIDKDYFLFCYERIREVSLNTSDSFSALIFDVDLCWCEEEDNLDWQIAEARIPKPSWITVNPRSGKFHVVYLLDRIYLKRYENYIRKFNKIYKYFCPLLGGDPAYKCLWTHNPLFSDGMNGYFNIPIVNNVRYSLDQLFNLIPNDIQHSELPATHTDSAEKVKDIERRSTENKIVATGVDYRNNTIFMRLMWFAKFKPEADLMELATLWRDKYHERYPNKLYMVNSEILAIVRSVEKYKADGSLFVNYCVDLFDVKKIEKTNEFTAIQADRGKKSGVIRKNKKQEKMIKMKELWDIGYTKEEIMTKLALSERSYKRYSAELNKSE